MEKQLSKAAYWLGIICTVLALVTRGLAMVGVRVFPVATPGVIPLSYRSFLDAALMFFIMAIASSVALWVKEQRT